MTFPKVPSPRTLCISYAFFFWNEGGWGSSVSEMESEGMVFSKLLSSSAEERQGWEGREGWI